MPKPNRDPSKLGARLAPRIARHVQRAMAQHLRDSADTRARIGAQAMHRFIDVVGQEADRHGARIFTEAAESPLISDRLKPMLRFVAHGKGELKSALAYSVYGTGFGTGLGAIITNSVTPFVARLIALEPNATLPPAAVADAYARGFIDHDQAQREAAYQGIDGERFSKLTEAARNYPALGEVLELRRRGELSDHDARLSLTRAGVPTGWHDALLALQWRSPSPTDLADQVVRGIIDQPQASEFAGMAGATPEEFKRLVLQSGEPPGLMQLLEAYRRGIINRARLEHGIHQSRYRDEWVDVIEALRHEPMSADAAIQAAVQGHLSEAQARAKAEDAGLSPADFDPIYQTHGEPPGVQEMLDLLNRGEMTQAEVEQGIRESRYKNKYVKAILARRRRLPPQDSVGAMVADGTLTAAQGEHYLRMIGFTTEDAHHLIAHHQARHTARHKQLTAAQLLELQADHLLDAAQVKAHLVTLGYTETVAGELQQLAEARREARIRARAVTSVHAAYVAWKITLREAENELDALHVPAHDRDQLTHAWERERVARRPVLTPAQLVRAAHLGLLTAEAARRRLEGHGYSTADATMLLAIAGVT